MALFGGASALGAAGIMGGMNLAGNLMNGANSQSTSDQWGNSSYGYQGQSIADSESWNRVFGSEASAEDIQRAAEANLLQDKYLLAQMQYNSKEAAVQRAWEEYMSNTSYQRAVEDLYKAGLNPILAAGNYGASTPMGAVASTGLQTAYKAQTFADSEGRSRSHSESEESGGGSSNSGGHSESKSEQQATTLVKAAGDTLKKAGTTIGEAVKTLTKSIDDMYSSGGGKSFYDKFDVPTVSN